MIKILHASQIRDWDHYTIEHEPISSIELMERASNKIVDALLNLYNLQHFTIFCGTGNNGGDGLTIARILLSKGKDVIVYQTVAQQYSADCLYNRKRLQEIQEIIDLDEEFEISIRKDTCIIDALLGTGQNRAVTGIIAQLVEVINNQSLQVVSVDIPTGMLTDRSSRGNLIIKADHVFSFQTYKLCFFLPENAPYTGQIHLIDIGLDPRFLINAQTIHYLLENNDIQPLIKKRKPFSHKGNYGNAMIIGGNSGMVGALILSLKGCLRSGAGKVYGVLDSEQFPVIHNSIPESLVLSRKYVQESINENNLGHFKAIGVGPGLGDNSMAQDILLGLLKINKPLILDADALNIIARNEWHDLIPSGSIITPHMGEFERLFGDSQNDFERLNVCLSNAQKYHCYIILKGRYTAIATPEGNIYFNPTGNPGMAKGGTGDVLTGILTSFLAQGMNQRDVCLLSVYLHGLAGDLAVKETSEYSLLASDIIEKIGASILYLTQTNN